MAELQRAIDYMGDANQEVWDLWQFIQNQWCTSLAGPTSLDLNVAFHLAPVLEIEITRPVLMKLKALERAALNRMKVKPGDKNHDLSPRRGDRRGVKKKKVS